MKNSIAILGLVLTIVLVAGASTSFAVAKPQNDNLVKVFVHFTDTPGKSEWGLIRAFGGTVTNSYSIIPAVSADIP